MLKYSYAYSDVRMGCSSQFEQFYIHSNIYKSKYDLKITFKPVS